MQGRISGFFMTAVMALPLAVIPLMSIFGIPQFGSLASTLNSDVGFLPEDPATATSWESAPVFSSADSGKQNRAVRNSMVVPVSNSLPNQTASNQNSTAFSSNPGNTLSWEQAIAQLARYGIHDYRLQPGLDANTFHFACYLHGDPTGKNSATVIRFEAEAANPLVAVQNTLLQIEQWYR